MYPPPINAGAGTNNEVLVPLPMMQSIPMMPVASATAADSNGTATMNQAPPEASNTSNGISEDEIALYDRQIRLWGMKAQERIRNANILLITIKGLGNEIAKNLVLAGIGSLTVVDDEAATEADLGAQFFLSAEEGHVGMNRAEAASVALRKLNPRVRVLVDTGNIRSKGPSFFAPFHMVVATDLDPLALQVINTATRLNNRPLYAAGTHGVFGFIFADLIEHDFVIERARSNLPTAPGPETPTRSVLAVAPKPGNPKTEQVTKRESYSTWFLASDGAGLPEDVRRSARRRRAVTPALSCLRALWEFEQTYGRFPEPTNRAEIAVFTTLCTNKHKALGLPAETLRSEVLRSFLQNVGAEIAPATALLGGQLAQDVINVLGRNQQPIQNFVIFDGSAMEATMYALHPEGTLGARQLTSSNSAAVGAGLGLGLPAVSGSNGAASGNGSGNSNGDPSLAGGGPAAPVDAA